MHPIIVNLCITGMIPTKEQNLFAPISPEEIIKTALECAKLGASIIHIHPRNSRGRPTWKKEVFAKIIEGVRNKNDKLILSVTTSGRFWSEFEKRSQVLELTGDVKPDLASLTVGSFNFIKDQSINSPKTIEKLALKMREKGIKPELEIFEPGMIHKANYLIKKSIIKDDRPYFNLFLGSLGTSPLHPASFAAYNSLLPTNAVWSVAGVGRYQLDANIVGLAFGGHVRVGLEDTLYFDREKKQLASNQKLVKRIVQIIKLMRLKVATPSEARTILGI